MICFDIAQRSSFDNVEKWHSEAVDGATNKNLCYILVGCKSDLSTDRQVSMEEATQQSADLGIPYMEVSSKQFLNVEELFTTMATTVLSTVSQVAREDEKLRPSTTPGSSCSRCV